MDFETRGHRDTHGHGAATAPTSRLLRRGRCAPACAPPRTCPRARAARVRGHAAGQRPRRCRAWSRNACDIVAGCASGTTVSSCRNLGVLRRLGRRLRAKFFGQDARFEEQRTTRCCAAKRAGRAQIWAKLGPTSCRRSRRARRGAEEQGRRHGRRRGRSAEAQLAGVSAYSGAACSSGQVWQTFGGRPSWSERRSSWNFSPLDLIHALLLVLPPKGVIKPAAQRAGRDRPGSTFM